MRRGAFLCAAAVLFAAPLLFGGCMGAQEELEAIAVIKGTAFDMSNTAAFRLSACVRLADESGADRFSIKTVDADSFAEALSSLPGEKTPFMGQNELVAIGEPLARRGVEQIVSELWSRRERDGAEQLVVIRGEAAKVYETEPDKASGPASAASAALENAAERGFVSLCTLSAMHRGSEARGACALVPVAQVDEGQLRITGMAVFCDYVMTDELSEKEMRGVRWLCGGAENAGFSVRSADETLGMTVERMEITMEKEPGKVKWDIACTIICDGPDKDADMARIAAENTIKSDALSAVAASKRIGADFLGAGDTDYVEEVTAEVKIKLR